MYRGCVPNPLRSELAAVYLPDAPNLVVMGVQYDMCSGTAVFRAEGTGSFGPTTGGRVADAQMGLARISNLIILVTQGQKHRVG